MVNLSRLVHIESTLSCSPTHMSLCDTLKSRTLLWTGRKMDLITILNQWPHLPKVFLCHYKGEGLTLFITMKSNNKSKDPEKHKVSWPGGTLTLLTRVSQTCGVKNTPLLGENVDSSFLFERAEGVPQLETDGCLICACLCMSVYAWVFEHASVCAHKLVKVPQKTCPTLE